MVQIFLAIVIIALGFYVFKCFPFEKGNVKKMIIAAIFVLLTMIAKRLAIMIPLFGFESFKVGIEYIPLMLAGYFLSPSYAFLVGLASDMVSLILVPTGFPFLGFTLGTILVSVIPSMVKTYFYQHQGLFLQKTVSYLAQGLICLLALLASFYIYQLDSIVISSTTYMLEFNQKFILMIICIVLMIIFISIIQMLKRKINEKKAQEFSIWLLSVTLTEIIVTLCLTPLWLDIMYAIPFVVSLCIRVIKLCIVLPLEIFVGYTLINILKRMIKE